TFCIIRFINGRESETALEYVLRNGGRCELYLWSSLSTALGLPWSCVAQDELCDFLTAMWRVARLRIHELGSWDESRLTRLASVVEALSGLKYRSPSLKALILNEIFTDFAHKTNSGMLDDCSPSDWLVYYRLFLWVQVKIPDTKPADIEWDLNRTWVAEARINIVAEFLDQCASDSTPYEAIKTLETLNTHKIILKVAINAACWNIGKRGESQLGRTRGRRINAQQVEPCATQILLVREMARKGNYQQMEIKENV
ncbi:hypothetical protein DFH06DRAFT_1408629, partial [Mycena polygramma]